MNHNTEFSLFQNKSSSQFHLESSGLLKVPLESQNCNNKLDCTNKLVYLSKMY